MNNFDIFGLDETEFKGREGTFTHQDYPGIKFLKSGFLKEWIDELLKEKEIKTILDIGALEGGDSLRFSSWYPEATIYTIEGSPNNYKVINNKIGNRLNVKIFNYAISDKNGEVPFYGVSYTDFDHDGMMIMGSIYQYTDAHIAQHSHLRPSDPVIVESITFDKFCELNNISTVDVAHIDIEGATYNLVLGMNKVLPKLIYTEQEAMHVFKDKNIGGNPALHALLESKGYELLADFGNDYLYKLKNL